MKFIGELDRSYIGPHGDDSEDKIIRHYYLQERETLKEDGFRELKRSERPVIREWLNIATEGMQKLGMGDLCERFPHLNQIVVGEKEKLRGYESALGFMTLSGTHLALITSGTRLVDNPRNRLVGLHELAHWVTGRRLNLDSGELAIYRLGFDSIEIENISLQEKKVRFVGLSEEGLANLYALAVLSVTDPHSQTKYPLFYPEATAYWLSFVEIASRMSRSKGPQQSQLEIFTQLFLAKADMDSSYLPVFGELVAKYQKENWIDDITNTLFKEAIVNRKDKTTCGVDIPLSIIFTPILERLFAKEICFAYYNQAYYSGLNFDGYSPSLVKPKQNVP